MISRLLQGWKRHGNLVITFTIGHDISYFTRLESSRKFSNYFTRLSGGEIKISHILSGENRQNFSI